MTSHGHWWELGLGWGNRDECDTASDKPLKWTFESVVKSQKNSAIPNSIQGHN